MSEQTRLGAYYPFDDDVLDIVSEVAERQRASKWQDIQTELPESKVFAPRYGKPIEVLDFLPFDYGDTQVYHLPMGNTLDANMSLRVATLAAAEPTSRIIAVGNPGSLGRGHGKLRLKDAPEVWRGDLRPVIEPTMLYLEEQKIEEASHIGFSYGADRASASARHAYKYAQKVAHGIFMEPASVAKRSSLSLAMSFFSTAESLERYVQAANCRPYEEARRLAASDGGSLANYALGLARASNLAIGHSLTKGGFGARAYTAMLLQPEMQADIIWGTASELSVNGLITAIAERLKKRFGERIDSMTLDAQRHAMGDDIFLHTAMILQALK